MKHNIYLFSGLGADARVFANLNFPNCTLFHIEWPTVSPQTTSEEFLENIKDQIKTLRSNIFLGVSFGGIVAQDMAAILPAEKLIIISSVTDSVEIPKLYTGRLASLALKMIPNFLLTKPNFLIQYMFSVETADGRKTLRDVIRDTDPIFLKWAMEYLKKWQRPSECLAKKVYRLHGSKDRIFPNVTSRANTEFVPGGHFAVYEAANEINRCLKSWL